MGEKARLYSAFSGPLAQLVEQGTLNPKVVGSIPTRPIFGCTPEARTRKCQCRPEGGETAEETLLRASAVPYGGRLQTEARDSLLSESGAFRKRPDRYFVALTR